MRFFVAPLVFVLASARLLAESASSDESFVFAEDGAWCWFSDPRAIVADDAIYAGWIDSEGSIEIGKLGLDDKGSSPEIQTVAPEFEKDDHDHPALRMLPSGQLAVFYAPHAWGDMHMRVTEEVGEIGDWSADRTLGLGSFGAGPQGVTYANPFVLEEEDNALYLFWRGSHFKPSFVISRDGGDTWGEPRTLISEAGADFGVRPYVKYWSDGQGRIDFLFTDGHPRNEATNSVYYLRYEGGVFKKADGSVVGKIEDAPFAPEQCDRIYDGSTLGRAWVWSLAADEDGNPVALFTALPSEDDHRFHVANWVDGEWRDREVVQAGGWFPDTPEGAREREPHYSGGASLDPDNPYVFYATREIDGVFEVERWESDDRNRSWNSQPITSGSERDNVRPVVLEDGDADREIVMWMRNVGGYRHYTDYRSEIRCLIRKR